MIESVEVDSSFVHCLAGAGDWALRFKVLRDLLDYPPDHPDVVEAREKIPHQPWVAATLKVHNGDGTWGGRFHFYQKYRGTSWVLLHLSEVGAPPDLEPIRLGIDHLLKTARPVKALKGIEGRRFDGCEQGVYWRYPIACLTAHMAAVLSRGGCARHPVTRGALAACRHLFDPEEGFGCQVIDHSLQPRCMMTVPKVLKAFLAVPPQQRSPEDRAVIRQLVSLLKKFDLYRYVPAQLNTWYDWAYSASAAERRAAKPQWIEQGRAGPRKEKAGWTRFSFPHGYNSDVLEVLLLLGEAGVERDEVIDRGLEILLSKRSSRGMWKMVGGLNGKMWADIDQKGKPSPWITYRSLLAFKHFGLLNIK